MGLFGDLADLVGDAVGTVAGIAVAPLAVALGVTQHVVRRAIDAGCKTEAEIRAWVKANA